MGLAEKTVNEWGTNNRMQTADGKPRTAVDGLSTPSGADRGRMETKQRMWRGYSFIRGQAVVDGSPSNTRSRQGITKKPDFLKRGGDSTFGGKSAWWQGPSLFRGGRGSRPRGPVGLEAGQARQSAPPDGLPSQENRVIPGHGTESSPGAGDDFFCRIRCNLFGERRQAGLAQDLPAAV
jgi:hypothetical protein